MAIGDVYRMRVVWKKTANGAAAINDFYWRQEFALIFDTVGEDLWDAFVTDCEATYEPLISSLLSTTDVIFGKAPDFETEEVISTPFLQGTASGDPLPGFTCGLLARYTATLSRRGRGRLYIPSATEGLNTDGAPSGTYTTALQAFGDAMLPTIGDNINTSVYTPMLWSETDQVARVVTSFRARSIWGIQRDRRKLFEG